MMKELGEVSYYLEIQVFRDMKNMKIFLFKLKHLMNILDKFIMKHYKCKFKLGEGTR
jgi:hypothetical protein